MSRELLIVSGKGGVGKTLLAASLARRFAEAGHRTLLVDLSDADAPAGPFGVAHRYQPQRVAANLDVSRLDARDALNEYVRRKMTFSFAYRGLLANSAVQSFLDALPLFDELMALGKLYDYVTSAESPYERVVFDAPATGHCKLLLNVPSVAVDTLKAGPIFENAGKILSLLRDPTRCQLVVATLPEETPAREAIELIEFARSELFMRCERLVVNRCIDSLFSAEERAVIAALPSSSARQACELNEAIAGQQAEQRQRFEGLGVDLTMLPEVVSRRTADVLDMMRTQL